MIGAGIVVSAIAVALLCYSKVPQGMALVRSGCCGQRVSFNGLIVFPLLHSGELVDMTSTPVELDFRDDQSVLSADSLPVQLRAVIVLGIEQNEESLLEALKLGKGFPGSSELVCEHFDDRFRQAVRQTVASRKRAELFAYESVRDIHRQIKDLIGDDLDGFVIEDVSVEFFEPVVSSQLADNDRTEHREEIS